jgi:hypothetical protein
MSNIAELLDQHLAQKSAKEERLSKVVAEAMMEEVIHDQESREKQQRAAEELDDEKEKNAFSNDGADDDRELSLMGPRKKITDHDRYELVMRSISDLVQVNRGLYIAVNTALDQRSSQIASSAPSQATSSTVSSSKKAPKPQKKSKADEIREQLLLDKEFRLVEQKLQATENTITLIERADQIQPHQIVTWLRIAGGVKLYELMICSAILQRLNTSISSETASADTLALCVELMQPWGETLDQVQDAIDEGKRAVTPYSKLCKATKKKMMEVWLKTLTSLERELKKTVRFTDPVAWNRYQMKEIAGVRPNSLYDIATYRAHLSPWQLELIELTGALCDADAGKSLLIHSATTSGKTSIVLFQVERFVKAGYRVLYLAPGEILALQSAALVKETCTGIGISVYTESLEYKSSNADVFFIVPGYHPEDLPMDRPILLLLDEFHVVDNPEYIEYRSLAEMVAPAVKRAIVMSATVANPEGFLGYVSTVFSQPFTTTGTSIRPVRMRFYDSALHSLHPWATVSNWNTNVGLASGDLEIAYGTLERHLAGNASALTKLNQTIAGLEAGLDGGLELITSGEKLRFLNMDALDRFETALAGLVKETGSENLYKTAVQWTGDTRIENFYKVLKNVAKNGSVVVFSDNAYETFDQLSRLSNLELYDTVPFWNDLLSLERSYVARLQKLKTNKYIEAVERKEELDGKKIRDAKGLNETINAVNKSIDAVMKERGTTLQAMLDKWQNHPSESHIRRALGLQADELSDEYSPYQHMRLGQYSPLNISRARELYPGLIESHCRTLSHGLAYIEDDLDLQSSIRLLAAQRDRSYSVLIAERKKLALGVNLSLATSVIYDPAGVFTDDEIKQQSGRAGRKGIDRTGTTVYIRPSIPTFLETSDFSLSEPLPVEGDEEIEQNSVPEL